MVRDKRPIGRPAKYVKTLVFVGEKSHRILRLNMLPNLWLVTFG